MMQSIDYWHDCVILVGKCFEKIHFEKATSCKIIFQMKNAQASNGIIGKINSMDMEYDDERNLNSCNEYSINI